MAPLFLDFADYKQVFYERTLKINTQDLLTVTSSGKRSGEIALKGVIQEHSLQPYIKGKQLSLLWFHPMQVHTLKMWPRQSHELLQVINQ